MGVNIPLAFAADRRDVGRFPQARSVNVFAEQAPSAMAKGVALLTRPGMSVFYTSGQVNNRGIFQQAGTFDGDFLVVSDDILYRIDQDGNYTALGIIPGTGLVTFASDGETVRIATGTGLYKTLGLTVEFDNADICSIVHLRGYWFGVRTSTQVVEYLLPGDTAWDPLQFISAESLPDKMRAIALVGDQMAFLGESTLEMWALTGTSSPPAEPFGGLNFRDKGVLTRFSIVESIDNGSCWVGSDKVAYVCRGGVPERISTHGVEERIVAADADVIRAWKFNWVGHQFYVLHLGSEGTWVYDFATALWTTFASLGLDYWRLSMGAQAEWGVLGADTETGNLIQLSDDLNTDLGGPLVVEFTALLDYNERAPLRCDRLVLTMSAGHAPVTGQGSDPLIEVRYSNDQGQTFSSWKQTGTGPIGRYATSVVWRALGLIQAPGRLFHFRMSDPVTRRVSMLEIE